MPTGYVAYGGPGAATGAVRSASGLRTATIVLFWLTTAASVFLAVALFARKGVWEDFINDKLADPLTDLNNADSMVGGAVLLLWVTQLTSTILVCLWSKREVDNAKARGGTGLSSGMAAGGWWIPIGMFWLPFGQLKKAVAAMRGTAKSLVLWQVFFILWLIGTGINYSSRSSIDTADDFNDVTDVLNRQGLIASVAAVLAALAVIAAMRATKEVDRAVSGST